MQRRKCTDDIQHWFDTGEYFKLQRQVGDRDSYNMLNENVQLS